MTQAPGPYRIVVTGSPSWADSKSLSGGLYRCWIESGTRPVVLVTTADPTGAAHQARQFAAGMGWTVEERPGAHLLDDGADVCLVFGTGGAVLAGADGVRVLSWPG